MATCMYGSSGLFAFRTIDLLHPRCLFPTMSRPEAILLLRLIRMRSERQSVKSMELSKATAKVMLIPRRRKLAVRFQSRRNEHGGEPDAGADAGWRSLFRFCG